MRYRHEAELNIIGLAIGISFEDDSYAERVRTKCRQNALLIAGDTGPSLFPPLTLDVATANEGLDILENCL